MALTYGSDEWEEAYQKILQRRLAENEEPYIQGTLEWVDKYEKLIQGDEAYREAARGWEGTVVLHTLAQPEAGIEEDSYMLMDLWHGECRKIRIVPPEVGEAADYVISGGFDVWKRISKGELDTNKAVMQGKLKLKGDLSTIVRYNQASARLTELSSGIDDRFADEVGPEEREELKQFGEEFKRAFS